MKYKYILQEMKEAGDPNVLAFLRDTAHIKRMSKKQRDFCLQNRERPESLKKLVQEFIPYIIMVAYGYSGKANALSLLDLINEGVLGAYAAFKKSCIDGRLTKKSVKCFIRSYIHSAVKKDLFLGVTESEYRNGWDFHDTWKDEDDLIEDINTEWTRLHLTNLIMEKMGERDGSIIIEYYLSEDADLGKLGKKYGLSRERIRQITQNFSKLFKRTYNLKSVRAMY